MNEAHEVVAWRLERDLDGRPGWAHPSCMALLEGLSVAQATWRPGPGKRCIWELVRHMRNWREYVAARLEGDEGARPGEEWPAIPQADDPEASSLWREDVEALVSTTARIAAALRALPGETRHHHVDYARWPLWISPLGVLQHDSYHLGQIALLRGLQGLAAVE